MMKRKEIHHLSKIVHFDYYSGLSLLKNTREGYGNAQFFF